MSQNVSYHLMTEFVEEFYNTKNDKENDRQFFNLETPS